MRAVWFLLLICCLISPPASAALPQPPRLLAFTPAIREETTWTEWIGQWTTAIFRWSRLKFGDPPIHRVIRDRSEMRRRNARQLSDVPDTARGNVVDSNGEIIALEKEAVEDDGFPGDIGTKAPTYIHDPFQRPPALSRTSAPLSRSSASLSRTSASSPYWLRSFVSTSSQKKTMQALTREFDFQGRATLHLAAMENDMEAVDNLLDWIDVDFRDSRGATALHYAAQRGHVDMVALLLKHGADLEAVDSQGWTPLWYAIQSKNHDLVQLLLLRKPTVLQARIFQSESTPIHFAAWLCSPEIIMSLLADGADLLAQDALGNNVFMMIAAVGCVEGATPIVAATPKLQRHSLLNHQNQDRASALHFAAYFGQSAVVDWLLPRLRLRQDHQGLYPHHYASLMGHRELAETLYTSFLRKSSPTREVLLEWRPLSEPTYLMDAVERVKVREVRTLLDEKNANVNAALCGSHMTALHVALKKGTFLISRELLRRGANVNAVFLPEKETPLHLAVEAQRLHLVQLIIGEGADLDTQDRHGFTALARAITKRDMSLFLTLLEAGASPTITVENGSTMLMLAAQANAGSIARHLLDLQLGDVNVFNRNRETALSLAIAHRHTDMVSLLLEKTNLDSLDLFDPHSITPLGSAVTGRQLEMMRLLLGAGAKQFYRGGYEYPLHLALKAGYEEITVALLDQGDAPVNELSVEGETPLYLAVKQRASIEVIRKLMDLGADSRAYSPPKLSALELAKTMGNVPYIIMRQLESSVKLDPGARALVDEFFTKPQKCSICLNTITKGKGAYISRCHHPFHQDCVHLWEKRQIQLQQDNTCPLCRQALSSLIVL